MASCKACHRQLSNPESIKRGYGPVCASKIKAEEQVQSLLDSDLPDEASEQVEVEEVEPDVRS